LECEAGTVVLIHYDIWHRGTANNGDINRYMFKFQFTRMEPPLGPSWNAKSTEWPLASTTKLFPLHTQVWKWMHGDFTETPKTIEEAHYKSLVKALEDTSTENEPDRLVAAYTLAQTETGVYELLKLMYSPEDSIRRSAMYGLGSVRNDVIAKELADMLGGKLSAVGVSDTLAALGMMGKFSAVAIPTVLKMLTKNNNVYTKRTAADVLGHIVYWLKPEEISKELSEQMLAQVTIALEDNDAQTRFNLCLSLGRMAKTGCCEQFVPALENCAWNDANRYVRAYAVDVLQRIGTRESLDVFAKVLWATRYCSLTTAASQF